MKNLMKKEKKEIKKEITPKGIEDNEKKEGTIWEKIGRICLYLLVFLAPIFFLPFTLTFLETHKYFLAIILILITFLCYLISSLERRKVIYPHSLMSLGVLIFLAICALSAIFSQAGWVSVFGNFIQNDTLLNFLIYGLAFFLAAVFIRKEDLSKIGLCFFGGLLLTQILGLLYLFQKINFNPLGSIFGWGVFITFGLVMIIAVLSSLKLHKIWKISLGLLGLSIFATLILLNFQLLWMGLALAMFLLLMLYTFVIQSDLRLPLAIIILSLFFVLANRYLPTFPLPTTEVRPVLTTTLDITKGVFAQKQILLGSGPATFHYNFTRFRPPELIQTAFWDIKFNQGFSFFTTIWSTLGILGILTFLFIIYSFLREGFAIWREEKFLIIFVGTFFLIINLFLFPASFVHLLFVFLGLGLLILNSKKSLEMEFYSLSKLRNFQNFLIFSGMILLITFSVFLLFLGTQKYIAAIYYEKGIRNVSPPQSVTYLEKAVKLDPHSDQHLRALSNAYLSQVNDLLRILQAQETPEKRQEIQTQIQNTLTSAVNIARRATELNSINSLNWSNFASICENIMLMLMPAREAEGFFAQAEQNYKKAIELDPKNPQLTFQLGVLYYRTNRIDLAQTKLERAVALNENYSNARYFLGLIYDQKGDKQKAIEQFERVELLNPENQEVKKILANLRAGEPALKGILSPPLSPPESLPQTGP